ncbi:MAG: hypothetical protein EBU83_01165 [bacterium]|jgi:hypothetical protein|nr:hypothetical protein [Candidatus Aquidulcis sp.]
MSEIAARIADLFTWLSTIVPALVTPDWAALIRLLPLFVAPVVVLWLVSTGGIWTLLGITKPGPRLTLGAAAPTAAPLGADGRPHFPPGRPYSTAESAIYPSGSTRSLAGEPLLIACPNCLAVRLAERSACDACGLELRARTPIRVGPPAPPPPGGAARA